ncbi:unnamed protein product [Cyprideis torosa]|uniref:Ras-related protein Rab-35 n=1 Tax=Cyprideis torosa TaxID=163714 RepID=A0A7R8ZUM8_9CRUS|nr:unnamed protein product [Cyprideis torosa]CAG0900561.1 unnamed protein product [Cyprideis torosa]
MLPKDTTKDHDHIFKLLIIGDSAVGKSSLLLRFADNAFTGSSIPTIGVDFKIKTLNIEGQRIKLQIWDTAGQERFRCITGTYYRGTHGVIVVYSVTSAESFASVQRWLEEIDNNCDVVNRILVGNKDDDPENKVVLREDAEAYAKQMGIQLFETSAKENKNVDEMFYAIAHSILKKKLESEAREKSRGSKALHGGERLGLDRGGSAMHGKAKKCCSRQLFNFIWWLVILVFLSWWIACICFPIFTVLSVLESCIPSLGKFADVFLEGAKFPRKCAQNMVRMNSYDAF